MPSEVSIEPEDPALITVEAKAKKLKDALTTTKKKIREHKKKTKK